MSWLYDAKKNMNVIRVLFAGIFASSPLALSGILKTPRARWRALGPPLRPPFVARGVFKIPDRAEGYLAKIPAKKPE